MRAGLMMPARPRGITSSGRLGSLPAPAVACLCLVSFLLGYVVHRPATHYDAGLIMTPPRKLQSKDMAQQQHIQAAEPPDTVKAPAVQAAVQAPQQQAVLQYNSSTAAPAGQLPNSEVFAQAFLEQSGLLKLRPPLQPAASGSDHYTVVPYQILSWHPRILVYPNFIDQQQAQHIITLAKGKMRPSGLSWRPGETPDEKQQVRTSTGVFLDSHDDPVGVLSRIEEKIASVTLLPVNHGEAFNVLRYNLNQKYDSHMDTFDPKEFGPQRSQRMATMLLYLSDVEEGGETVFKKEGKDGADRPVSDWASCEEHEYKYKPRMGDAVLFYSLDPDLTINPRSLHGGCAVMKGEKWVATKWMHEKPWRPWS